MEEVNCWLNEIGLGEYSPNFVENGWDEISLLKVMTEEDLEMCISKRGHRAKFRMALTGCSALLKPNSAGKVGLQNITREDANTSNQQTATQDTNTEKVPSGSAIGGSEKMTIDVAIGRSKETLADNAFDRSDEFITDIGLVTSKETKAGTDTSMSEGPTAYEIGRSEEMSACVSSDRSEETTVWVDSGTSKEIISGIDTCSSSSEKLLEVVTMNNSEETTEDDTFGRSYDTIVDVTIDKSNETTDGATIDCSENITECVTISSAKETKEGVPIDSSEDTIEGVTVGRSQGTTVGDILNRPVETTDDTTIGRSEEIIEDYTIGRSEDITGVAVCSSDETTESVAFGRSQETKEGVIIRSSEETTDGVIIARSEKTTGSVDIGRSKETIPSAAVSRSVETVAGVDFRMSKHSTANISMEKKTAEEDYSITEEFTAVDSVEREQLLASRATSLESFSHNEPAGPLELLNGPRIALDNAGKESGRPVNITYIEHSEITTIAQRPTQVASETDVTQSPVKILKGQMHMLAESFQSEDHLYVETKAYRELKEVVDAMYWATLLGKPGDGKSATAAHLLLQYAEKGYEPVFLTSPRDWKMSISECSSSKQIVMIDDMFGISCLNDNNYFAKWKSMLENMNREVKQRKGKLLVVCTSRKYIFKDVESALGKYSCFVKHAVVDMTDEKYELSGDEKAAIFKMYVENYEIVTSFCLSAIIRYVDPPHGFPHCVKLFCTDVFFRKDGISFFRNPVQFVEKEIRNFMDNDHVKFLVLLLVLHKGNQLETDFFDRLLVNTTDDEKKIFQTAGVAVETSVPDIQRALKGLTNTYLKENKDGSYSFSHHSLQETLACIYMSANPSHAVQILDFRHINAFTNLRDNSRYSASKLSQTHLPLDDLAKRVTAEIRDGNIETVSASELWNDQTFVRKWLSNVEKGDLLFLETLLLPRNTYHSVRNGKKSLLAFLMNRKRQNALIRLFENKPVGETLKSSDLWRQFLQEVLEEDCVSRNGNFACIRTLISLNCVEDGLKLDGSKSLAITLMNSDADRAMYILQLTKVIPGYKYSNFGYFRLLVESKIQISQFETLCKMLVEASVDINQVDGGVPPVFHCLLKMPIDCEAINRLLCMVKFGADINWHSENENATMLAVKTLSPTRCLPILEKLSEQGLDYHYSNTTRSNALHIICQKFPQQGSLSLLEYLLKKDVSCECINLKGEVPLMLALKQNHEIDFIKRLAEKSPRNHVNEAGQSYFHYLWSSGDISDDFCSKCEILMSLSSPVDAKDNLGQSPIVQFIKHPSPWFDETVDLLQTFQFLDKIGMDLTGRDGEGRNIVLIVLKSKVNETTLPVLLYLHEIGLDLGLSDNNGRNVLHYLFTAKHYNEKVLKAGSIGEQSKREFHYKSGLLVKAVYEFLTGSIGVSLLQKDINGVNPVMLALERCAGFSFVGDLLKLDLPVQQDNEGNNYFHYLLKSRAPDDKFTILKSALNDKGLSVNEQLLNDRPKQICDDPCVIGNSYFIK